MLKQFSHSALTAAELVRAAERLLQCISKQDHRKVLENRIKKTTDASNYLSEALNESLSNVYASRVQQADLERDDAFQAFKYGVLSASFRGDGPIKMAGERLVEIVRKHGFNLYNLGYIAQSEAMRALMEELENNKMEVANSGVADLLAEMVNANDIFNKVYHDKVIQKDGHETPQIVVRKNELSKQITLFLNHVELLEEDKFGGVKELVDKINTVISGIMEEARVRK